MPTTAAQLPLGRRVVALAFLCFAYFFYSWSWNTVDVLRPYIAESLGLTLEQAGSLYSAQALGAVAGALIISQIADRLGRRRALIGVMVGIGATLMAGIAIGSYFQALVHRSFMGFFLGGMFPIVAAIYAGLFPAYMRGRIASVVLGVYWLGVAALSFGLAALFKLELDWHWLYWAGALPVAAAVLALVLVPKDALFAAAQSDGPRARLPIVELFAPVCRRMTLLFLLLSALNFVAIQAFSGWATTYLRDVRGMTGEDVGIIVGWQYAGGIAGTFIWGWFADRFGRRAASLGFIIGASMVPVFLFLPLDTWQLAAVAGVYGAAVSATLIWGPWLTELYPEHLRSTAASIFNWGRIISFIAPVLTGFMAGAVGLGVTMSMASVLLIMATIIWLRLPETLTRRAAG